VSPVTGLHPEVLALFAATLSTLLSPVMSLCVYTPAGTLFEGADLSETIWEDALIGETPVHMVVTHVACWVWWVTHAQHMLLYALVESYLLLPRCLSAAAAAAACRQ
jgi:hypothetical protein